MARASEKHRTTVVSNFLWPRLSSDDVLVSHFKKRKLEEAAMARI